MKEVKICGIPHSIKEVDIIESESAGVTQGLITYSEAKIQLKKSLPEELKKSVLYHEVTHGILTLIGRDDLSNDEVFVQNLSMELYKMFDFKEGILC